MIDEREKYSGDIPLYEVLGNLNNELVNIQRGTYKKNIEMSHLAAIVESSEEAITSTDLDGIFISWNAAAERLYGYPKSEALGKHITALSLPMPGQTDLVAFVFERLRRGELAQPIEVVHTLKDGSPRDVSLTLSPLRDDPGNISGIIGIAHDITERKKAEEAMLRSLSVLKAQQEAALDGILVVDENRRIISVNGRLREMWNIPAEITESGDDKRQLNYVSSLLKNPELFVERVMYLYDHPTEHSHEEVEMMDGRIFDRDSGPIISEEGKHYGRIWFFRDITARKQGEAALQNSKAALEKANHRLHILATRDGLTGLSNHRAFQERLEAEVRRANRHGQALSLIILDVDHFKHYNDTYGHPDGDAVLKRVASLLQNAARDTDVAARYGGEEFALILPQTSPDDALAAAERIRAAIASAPWDRRAITVSIGVCSLSENAADSTALIACADKALYRSKMEGKNRVTMAVMHDAPAPSAMMVLKRRTKAHHDALEHQMAPLLDGITRREYRMLLQRLFGYYQSLETQMMDLPELRSIAPDLEQRLKSHLLMSDLEYLGVSREALKRLPKCERLPEVMDITQALGCLYVLEEATLGGQIVLRHLRQHLGVDAVRGGAFFASYAENVGPMWRAFGQFVNRQGTSFETKDILVRAARDTFDTMNCWLFASETALQEMCD